MARRPIGQPQTLAPSVQLCIDPIGRQYGVGNTIQRAESVGLHQALSVPHCHHERVIATDSLCAMYMLSKHLRCPSLHRESKHLGILEAAVQAMAESLREGQDIRIIKVKSHIGIKGNEEADRLAHDACVRMNCHQQVLEGLPVREHIHWPVQAQPRIGSSLAGQAQPCLVPQRPPSELPARGTPAPCEEDAFVPEQQVNDLRKGMKALIRPILATGYAKRTIYGGAWKAANAYVLGDISNHSWKSATMPVVTQALKIQVRPAVEHEAYILAKTAISPRIPNAQV